MRFALFALLLCGCPLSHGDYPGRACNTNTDCFFGQGEVCNPTTRQCEVMIDAGPTPDRPPTPDGPADGGDFMDAPDMPDGGTP